MRKLISLALVFVLLLKPVAEGLHAQPARSSSSPHSLLPWGVVLPALGAFAARHPGTVAAGGAQAIRHPITGLTLGAVAVAMATLYEAHRKAGKQGGGAAAGAPDPDDKNNRRNLGYDPAKKKFVASEADTAERLERVTGQTLERDPTGNTDWIDTSGRTYDAVGPAPSRFFNYSSFSRSIASHLLKQCSYVVVDMTGMLDSQASEINSYIESLPEPQQVRIIKIGF